MVQFSERQYWPSTGLALNKRHAITWTVDDQDAWRHMASLGTMN